MQISSFQSRITKIIIFSVLLVSANVQAVTVSATDSINRFSSTVTADNRICRTMATTLQQIPGTAVKFNQGSSGKVVVHFSATWPKPSAADIPAGSKAAGAFIFLFIDGVRIDINSINGGVLVHEGTASSVSNGTHGFTFVTNSIAAGPHVAQMYFLDNVLGAFGVPNGTVCIDDRSIVVQHK